MSNNTYAGRTLSELAALASDASARPAILAEVNTRLARQTKPSRIGVHTRFAEDLAGNNVAALAARATGDRKAIGEARKAAKPAAPKAPVKAKAPAKAKTPAKASPAKKPTQADRISALEEDMGVLVEITNQTAVKLDRLIEALVNKG